MVRALVLLALVSSASGSSQCPAQSTHILADACPSASCSPSSCEGDSNCVLSEWLPLAWTECTDICWGVKRQYREITSCPCGTGTCGDDASRIREQVCAPATDEEIAGCRSVEVEFGVAAADSNPAGGWRLATSAQLNQYKNQFIAQYNANGFKTIRSFSSGNCCMKIADGMLTVSGTMYQSTFPANAETMGIACNPTNGYSFDNFRFYMLDTLDTGSVIGADPALCIDNENPGVFIRTYAQMHEPVEFGVFDSMSPRPSGGWEIMSLADISDHAAQLVRAYNDGGIPVLDDFSSGNCCMKTKGGDALVISGTSFGYAFPALASSTDTIYCNPAGGYQKGEMLRFLNVTTLDDSTQYAELNACVSKHNPALYYRKSPHMAATAPPTASPTPAPTYTQHSDCQNGPNVVHPGWVGAGYGSEYCKSYKCCNDATCDDGTLVCANENCENEVVCGSTICPDGQTCDSCGAAFTCAFEYSAEAGKDIVVVRHKGSVSFSHHKCTPFYNQATNEKSCSCTCWNEAAE